MKYRVEYGQIRPSERRVIYRNAIDVLAENKDTAAERVARTFGVANSESDWVIISVEEYDD